MASEARQKQPDYVAAAMALAEITRIARDGTFWGEIPGFPGVWAHGATEEGCRQELESVLADWIRLRVQRGLALPSIPEQTFTR